MLNMKTDERGVYMTFGEFLSQKRKEKNLTQKELAGMLYVSESAVCKWEKNVARPDINLLPKLSEILSVTEHELITASVDEEGNRNRRDARKWRRFSLSWDLFFIIGYGAALLTCLIVNLAVGHTLSWFWIVFTSLLFAATFTTFPKRIRFCPLILIPVSELAGYVLMLVAIALYAGGGWLVYAIAPVVAGFLLVFVPIWIACEPFPDAVKSHNALISVSIAEVVLHILLGILSVRTGGGFYGGFVWIFLLLGYGVALATVGILRYLSWNGYLKTGLTLFGYLVSYLLFGYLTVPILNYGGVDTEGSAPFAPFRADFGQWHGDGIGYNVTFLMFSVLLLSAVVFVWIGIVREKKKRMEQ